MCSSDLGTWVKEKHGQGLDCDFPRRSGSGNPDPPRAPASVSLTGGASGRRGAGVAWVRADWASSAADWWGLGSEAKETQKGRAAAGTRTTRPRRCGREDSNARLRAAAGTRTLDCALQRGLCRGTKACSAATLAARRSGADGDTKNRGGTALLSPWIDREAYREELGVVVQA